MDNFLMPNSQGLRGTTPMNPKQVRGLLQELISSPNSPFTPQQVQAILNGRLVPNDHEVFAKFVVGSLTVIKVADLTNAKEDGIHNLKEFKVLPKQLLAIVGITLQTGVTTASTKPALMQTVFSSVDNTNIHANIASGTMKLSVDKQVYLEDFPLSNFKNSNRTDMPLGYFALNNPIFVGENEQIIPEIQLHDNTGLVLAVIRLGFDCVRFNVN